MKNRTMLRKLGRVTTVTLGAAMLATLVTAPAQAEVSTWTLTGPARETKDYEDRGGEAWAWTWASGAALDDIPALEQKCVRQDGVVESSTVKNYNYAVFWAYVVCASKRDVS